MLVMWGWGEDREGFQGKEEHDQNIFKFKNF